MKMQPVDKSLKYKLRKMKKPEFTIAKSWMEKVDIDSNAILTPDYTFDQIAFPIVAQRQPDNPELYLVSVNISTELYNIKNSTDRVHASLIYKALVSVCDEKDPKKLSYIFDVPVAEKLYEEIRRQFYNFTSLMGYGIMFNDVDFEEKYKEATEAHSEMCLRNYHKLSDDIPAMVETIGYISEPISLQHYLSYMIEFDFSFIGDFIKKIRYIPFEQTDIYKVHYKYLIPVDFDYPEDTFTRSFWRMIYTLARGSAALIQRVVMTESGKLDLEFKYEGKHITFKDMDREQRINRALGLVFEFLSLYCIVDIDRVTPFTSGTSLPSEDDYLGQYDAVLPDKDKEVLKGFYRALSLDTLQVLMLN